MEHLKPCPFCGGEAKTNYLRTHGWHSVMCKQCLAETMEFDTEQEAINAWNQRAERTCCNVDDCGDNIGGWRDWDTDGFGFTCSECHHILYPDEMGASPLSRGLFKERVKINYCPNCGAKVDG